MVKSLGFLEVGGWVEQVLLIPGHKGGFPGVM